MKVRILLWQSRRSRLFISRIEQSASWAHIKSARGRSTWRRQAVDVVTWCHLAAGASTLQLSVANVSVIYETISSCSAYVKRDSHEFGTATA
jgi:hypothetical protein